MHQFCYVQQEQLVVIMSMVNWNLVFTLVNLNLGKVAYVDYVKFQSKCMKPCGFQILMVESKGQRTQITFAIQNQIAGALTLWGKGTPDSYNSSKY